MESSNVTFNEQIHNPILQAAAAVAGIVLILLGAQVVKLAGVEVSELFPWMTAAVFMLCFALFNSVFSLVVKDMFKYWRRSIYSFMGLAFASGLLAWLFSSLPISEAGSYRWIYIVVTISYLVFLSIMALIRRIVEFAQREEWNQPRIRRHK
jgi:drug/metabolite transporter (DMT)-like permease